MSNILKIHCDTCKKTMRYGQIEESRNRGWVYYPDLNIGQQIEPLALFVMEHSGHNLHSSSSYAGDSSGINIDDYIEVDYNPLKAEFGDIK